MPVMRTIPTIKPARTERTHEENQERAYIAASRRSDRSLEARVESARRASEIHKKRTGRSLRVREEDVMNEEMYEEEDDDLPMQYRRINALNPHLSYAFAERLNNYVNGQIGVRTALQQAIAQSNQYQQNQQLLNSYMQSSGCYSGMAPPTPVTGYPSSPWPATNSQNSPATAFHHSRSASFASPQTTSHFQSPASAVSPNAVDARRMSLPPHVPGFADQHPSADGHAANSAAYAGPSAGRSPPQQVPSPPVSVSTPIQHGAAPSPPQPSAPFATSIDSQIAPLTTKLPNDTLQMLGGSAAFNPSFFAPEALSTTGKYCYNPNGKPKSACGSSSARSEEVNPFEGLNQTLSTSAVGLFPAYSNNMSSAGAPSQFSMPFDVNAFGQYDDDRFDYDFNSGATSGAEGNSPMFRTSSDPLDASFTDYFDFTQTTPEAA